MKRYKLTRSPNPETHASGEVIFIKDENGNELDVGFSNECDAFDYIKLQAENDKEYADYLNNPSKHIMDIYNSLDDFDKRMIEQSLIQKYRNECMYRYFRKENKKEAFPSDFLNDKENIYIENRKRGTENGKSISAYWKDWMEIIYEWIYLHYTK